MRQKWLMLNFNETALEWSSRAANGDVSCLVGRRSFWTLLSKFTFWSLVRIPGHFKQQQRPDRLFSICLWQRELLLFLLNVAAASVVCAFCLGQIGFCIWLPVKSMQKTKKHWGLLTSTSISIYVLGVIIAYVIKYMWSWSKNYSLVTLFHAVWADVSPMPVPVAITGPHAGHRHSYTA